MTDYLLLVKEQRHIFSVCPECGTVHRLSDLQLAKKGKYTPDWLDGFDKKRTGIENRMARLEEQASMLQKQAKLLAERTELPKALAKVAPLFTKEKVDPRHVRTIFDPVEFVVFNGMGTDDGVRSVTLLHVSARPNLVNSIEATVARKDYGWSTLKVNEDGTVEEKRPQKTGAQQKG